MAESNAMQGKQETEASSDQDTLHLEDDQQGEGQDNGADCPYSLDNSFVNSEESEVEAPQPIVSLDPRHLMNKIEKFTLDVSTTFKGIMGGLEQLNEDIKQVEQLKQVAHVAESMLAGELKEHIQVEAKGEVGKLIHAINKTLDNLEQLDQTVHKETGRVPELAAHLDNIAVETESATQQVLEKLDAMIEGSEEQSHALQSLRNLSEERVKFDREAKESIDQFIKKLASNESQENILQEAMEFVALMGHQASITLQKAQEVDNSIESASTQAENLLNHAFDIMNLLQFQDITRQKVSKVIGLLKEMQSGLFRLLEIFNITQADDEAMELSDKHKATQDRILERDAIQTDTHVETVDEIIKKFAGGQS